MTASAGGEGRLRRPIQPMPEDVAALLDARGLRQSYEKRPAYQRNDYLAWIARSKSEPTRSKRIEQMLTELARGGVYMNMKHAPSAPGR
jgi:uncharacterized protein YdeI (YjbR/CyaY-like superfamily)